jgi:hypothetical protein
MDTAAPGKILANLELPPGKQLYNHEGKVILIYQAPDPQTKQLGWRYISREMFSQISGQGGCPPLVRLIERGKSGKKNLGFCYLWVDQNTGTIYWRIGELSDGKIFETISWKSYSREPGRKNKGIGSQGSVQEQGLFEGSRVWTEFLEKKKYKLLFPEDEVVGNQLYFYRSTEPELLTSKFEIPEAMLAHEFEDKRLPQGPVIVQPKYDGKRNLCGKQGGKIISASRGRKQAKSQHPHIHQQLEVVFYVIQEKISEFLDSPSTNSDGSQGVQRVMNPNCSFWVDGEVFKMGISFQKLMSMTQSSVNSNVDSKELDYIVYDLIDNGTNNQAVRLQFLQAVFTDPRVAALPNVKLSPWYLVEDHSSLPAYHTMLENAGHEGAMVRDPNAFYVQKRTYAVMKMKNWIREEWYIVGCDVAHGFHEGCIIYILNSRPDGQGITCRGDPCGPEIGTLESRRSQYQNRHLFVRNPPVVATIEFFGRSNTGVPRFPGVIAFNRDDFIPPADTGSQVSPGPVVQEPPQ